MRTLPHAIYNFNCKAVLVLFLAAAFLTTAQAQFSRLTLTNGELNVSTIQASGAAAEHALKISIGSDGRITGSGRRYDVASNAVTPSPTNGRVIRVDATNNVSTLVGPVISSTNDYRWTNSIPLVDEDFLPILDTNGNQRFTNIVERSLHIESSCPAAIFLNDGTKIRGAITSVTNLNVNWDYSAGQRVTNRSRSVWMHGLATYRSGFGEADLHYSLWGGGGSGNPTP
jgi:hypothetical protein